MITTNDSALYDKLKPMINFGIPSTTYERSTKTSKSKKNKLSPGYVWDYEVNSLGYKAYMNDIQASIALAQLDKLNQFIKRRKMIQKTYNSELKEYIQLPPWSETAQLYPARVEKSHRNSLMNYLASKNIHTTVHFKPLHLHPILKHDRNFPVANKEWKKLTENLLINHYDPAYISNYEKKNQKIIKNFTFNKVTKSELNLLANKILNL